MNLIKIGKYIADSRKKVNLTQEQLGEKLSVTDRAVSKWERGLSLPDADKMLELCKILNINVNELLSGEKINMKDYERKTEELLLELSKQEELKNKKLMTSMWVLIITDCIFYVSILLLACNTLEEGTTLGIIIVLSTLLFVLVAFYALKLEIDAGYYECNNCHHKFIPRYLTAVIAPHVHTTRYMRCPKCKKITWAKKVLK